MTSIKSNHLIQVVSTFFIFLFVYTAVSKLMEFERFTNVLKSSPLIGNNNVLLAPMIPLVELTVSLLLVVPSVRKLGLYGAFILMCVFTTYVGYMIIFTPHLPCSCGGVLKQLTWKQHLLFNAFFTLMALFAIVIDSKNPSGMNHKTITV